MRLLWIIFYRAVLAIALEANIEVCQYKKNNKKFVQIEWSM